MVILGITGNSGVGKSKICNFIIEKGFPVIDTDMLGHEALAKNTFVYNDLVNRFGIEILDEDKNIIRKKLGSIVFNNRESLEFLSKCSHRYIEDRINSIIIKEKNLKTKLVVIDGALLLDTKISEICTEIWLITADINVRFKRIMERDNISRKEIEQRFKMQKDYSKQKDKFNLLIDNSDENFNCYKIIEENLVRLIGDI